MKNLKFSFFTFFFIFFSNYLFGQAEFDLTFENKQINTELFDLRRLCCDHSYSFDSTIVNSGKYSLKITLNKEDAFYRADGKIRKSAKKRAEIGTRDDSKSQLFEYGKEYWYRFSVYIPNDWVNEPNPENQNKKNHEVISQWHWKTENEDESGRPALSLNINSGQWNIINSFQRDSIKLNKATEVSNVVYKSEIVKGKWTTWTVNARWSADQNGILKIWMNDNLVVSEQGRNSNAKRDIVFKFGLYKPKWMSSPTNVDSRVIYFDDILISSSPLN